MIPYASHTRSSRNQAALRGSGWRLIVSPLDMTDAHGWNFGLDNGAWPTFEAHRRGEIAENRLDEGLFQAAVDQVGARADWIVAPDIVQGGKASLDLSISWLARLESHMTASRTLRLVAVQDGMHEGPMLERVLACVRAGNGIFVGGGTEWKERYLPLWGEICRDRGTWLHVGRVNTTRRVALCGAAGATSFDGTSASRFSKNVPKLTGAARQGSLIGTIGDHYVA